MNVIDIDNGTISYDGHTQPMPGLKGVYYTDAITNLNLLQYLSVGNIISNSNQNIDNASKQMELIKKMQVNMKNPAYFQTAQGKKEMQELISQQQQVGGNITNTGNLTKTQEAMIRQKTLNDPGYAGSAQFQKDMTLLQSERIQDKFRYEKTPMAEVAPGMARARVEDSFNPKGSEAFNGTLKGAEGPIEVAINIKVEKIQ